jgi:cysteine desulfurase
MVERTYLDWNASAPLRPEARVAMNAALDVIGNPSSVHAEGRAARRLIEDARAAVAALVGAGPRNVVFTSGGTEANMLALTPALQPAGEPKSRGRLLVSAIEHPSVLSGGRFAAADVEQVPVTVDGIVDLAALEQRLAELSEHSIRRVLVSLMAANNETGVIQPVAEAAAIVHAADGLLHVDAVQAVGRIHCDINVLCADLMTISGHKIGGPKGVGALIKRSEALNIADPLLKGGGQERGQRAGTEDVAAIAGFGAAAAAVMAGRETELEAMSAMWDWLEIRIATECPSAVIFGVNQPRIPNTTLFAVPGLKSETAVIGFDLEGVAVSAGSACSSGKVSASQVLAAMGVPPPLAGAAIRVSLGPTTTKNGIECFISALNKVCGPLARGQDSRSGGIAA